ncbi:MAG: HAMP domain-containing histidine kinase [Planctomycetales bacterium]|nr:HAMP domain-containing histidine kinase [Planctomycetales bacterium]
MNRTLAALWLAVLLAIGTLIVVSQLWVRQREDSAQERISDILRAQLSPARQSVDDAITRYNVEISKLLLSLDVTDQQDLLNLSRNPLCYRVFVARDDRIVFPQEARSSEDQVLVDEALQLLRELGDPRPSARISDQGSRNVDSSAVSAPQQNQRGSPELQVTNPSFEREDAVQRSSSSAPAQDVESQDLRMSSGWLVWYHRRGIMLGYWWSQGQQLKSLMVLPRGRWLSDIVNVLPTISQATNEDTKHLAHDLSYALVQLVDIEGNVVHQWSRSPLDQWDALSQQEANAELPLNSPLEGWRLQVFVPASLMTNLAGDRLVIPIWLAIGGISLSLVLLAVLATAQLDRQLRLARQQVTFVNQVSHELRTPLTNICIYADLVADALNEFDSNGDTANAELQLERIDVIQNESRRLNRLIENVLRFAKSSTASVLKLQPCVLDTIINEVVETFRPSLAQHGIELTLQLTTPQLRQLDSAAVEQMLVNLIANAEKYGRQRIHISTSGTKQNVEVTISDAGSGIAWRNRRKIFAPFVRLSNRLEDPAGTGIGLTIVRDLARKHGGDCVFVGNNPGATFVFTLAAPVASAEV